jgi:hypothetical protein
MLNLSVEELCLMSRALERAMRAVPNKPRTDITTHQLSMAILNAAKKGIREENILARWALEIVGIKGDPSARPAS